MFSIIFYLYWTLKMWSSFEGYDFLYEYGLEIHFTLLMFMYLVFKITGVRRYGRTVFLISLHTIMLCCLEIAGIRMQASTHILMNVAFSWWSIYVLFRPEIKTAKTIDYNNVILCFYRGNNGFL